MGWSNYWSAFRRLMHFSSPHHTSNLFAGQLHMFKIVRQFLISSLYFAIYCLHIYRFIYYYKREDFFYFTYYIE